MQPSLFNQDLSLQTHLTGTSDPEPFDHAKHMAAMSQKRWNKIDKQKSVIANQTQLNQSNAQLHGPGHLKAAIQQNAGMLSSVNAKAHDADKWQADPKYNLLLAKNPSSKLLLQRLVQSQPTGVYILSGCGVNCRTMSPVCNMLKSSTPVLSLNLSDNQIGESGMKVLARALGDPCFAQLKRLDIRDNWHDGIEPLTSALAVLGYRCWDGQPYKSPFFGIGWGCKCCGVPKAKHSTTRKLEHLEEFSSSLIWTKHQDVAALGLAISQGALPSLEHVDLDDFGHMLDSHLRPAIRSLKRAVAEKKSARKD